VNTETVTQVQQAVQHPHFNSDLDPAEKRLMLSAHLSLVAKKLRRGLCVEEREILDLLPFTVANGWQPESAVIDSGDEDWARRLAVATQ
jgi:hypothetical protein